MSKKYIILLLTLVTLIIPVLVFATNISDVIQGLDNAAQASLLIDSPQEASTIYTIGGRIVYFILSLLGITFLALILFGGLQWLTAAGQEEKITKAKGLITNAMIGLVIVLASYLIINFVVFTLIKKTNDNQAPVTNVDQLCLDQGGECQTHEQGETACTINNNEGTVTGAYVSNLCPSQPDNPLYRCCVPN